MTAPFFDNWRPRTRSQDYYDLECEATRVACAIRDGEIDRAEGEEIVRRLRRKAKRSKDGWRTAIIEEMILARNERERV